MVGLSLGAGTQRLLLKSPTEGLPADAVMAAAVHWAGRSLNHNHCVVIAGAFRGALFPPMLNRGNIVTGVVARA